jgi:hypothetical protein
MFDQLLLLTQHGEAVYFGDIGENGDALLSYASQFGYRMELESNPADFALEFATATNRIADLQLAEAEFRQANDASNDPTQDADAGNESADAVNESDEHRRDSESGEEPDFGDLSLSPDTPQPVTPITPLSTAPESPYIEASSSAPKSEREVERRPQEAGEYVESVEGLIQGYYRSDLYNNAMQEMDHIQPQEFKSISYPGTPSSLSPSPSSLPFAFASGPSLFGN